MKVAVSVSKSAKVMSVAKEALYCWRKECSEVEVWGVGKAAVEGSSLMGLGHLDEKLGCDVVGGGRGGET